MLMGATDVIGRSLDANKTVKRTEMPNRRQVGTGNTSCNARQSCGSSGTCAIPMS